MQLGSIPATNPSDRSRLKRVNRTVFRWGSHPLLVTLLMTAFCARALIPLGFMPGPEGLVLCPGYASMHGLSAPPAMSREMAGMAGVDMSGMDMSATDMPATDMSAMKSHFSHDGMLKHGSLSLCPFAVAATTMVSGHASVMAVVLLLPVARSIQPPSLPLVPRTAFPPNRLPRGPPTPA